MHFGENQLITEFDWPFTPTHRLIPSVFNLSGFGPPRRLTVASTWPWVDHSAGSRPSDQNALFGLAFATASPHGLTSPLSTNSQAHSSARRHPTRRLRRIVGTRFQDLFYSPPGVLFTFPSRYLSAIGHQGIFRLSGWSRQIHTGFLGPSATWDGSLECTPFRSRG